MSNFAVCFVLNGLQDGERGVYAMDTFGRQLRDGWYYIPDGDADGIGPYVDREAAYEAGKLHGKPYLNPSAVFLKLVEGKFVRFKDDNSLWETYGGASGDDLCYRDDFGAYILSTDNGRIVYEPYSLNRKEPDIFHIVNGKWVPRD